MNIYEHLWTSYFLSTDCNYTYTVRILQREATSFIPGAVVWHLIMAIWMLSNPQIFGDTEDIFAASSVDITGYHDGMYM